MRKLPLVLLALSALAWAEGTRTWTQSSFEEFEQGTAKGVAVRSDGGLELAPAFTALSTTPATYIWALTSDGQGNVYAASGSPARVYRITPDGKVSVIFDPKELQVQALVLGKDGALYAATSPDGKVYKITRTGGAPKKAADGAASSPGANAPPAEATRAETAMDTNYSAAEFFDPKTKYIWDLALDSEGRLYVATGDRGEIFRVTRTGESAVFFKSDEAHIRVLSFGPKGNLYAGSDGSGLIYRISPQGEAFVLYSAPKKEITALALDEAGNIYAAGVGEKRGAQPAGMPAQPPSAGGFPFSATATANPGQQPQPGAPPGMQPGPPAAPIFPPSFGASGGAEVYQISPDGSPKRVWGSREDIVYALALDSQGRLLAGTGNKGRVYVIQNNGDFTALLKASATQVTGFAKAPNGGLYAATSNLGKIFALGSAPQAEGTYESDVFDARIFSRWGRVEVRGRGDFDIYARSGNVDNPDRNWSPWQKADITKDAPLDAPAARFIQWRAVLRPGATPARITSVGVNYRPKNVAPAVDDVAVQVGARFQQLPRQSGGDDSGPISVGGGRDPQTLPQPPMEISPPAFRDRESIALKWQARDENDDRLAYSIYYRGDGESTWKLLRDELTDKYYSTETALFPDGGYVAKVVASDAPSHSPEDTLTDEKESTRFEIDTTPPVIADLHAARDGESLRVTFRASDGFSPIARAEYSIDAGAWQFVEPVGEISDSKSENYDFTVPVKPVEEPPARGGGQAPKKKSAKPADSEHVVVVRAYDRFSNLATAKTVIRAK